MAALSDAALLEALRETLDALVTGRAKSVQVNGKALTKLDIKDIRATIDWLEKRQSRAANGGFSTSRFVPTT